jgi:hypothetical protein
MKTTYLSYLDIIHAMGIVPIAGYYPQIDNLKWMNFQRLDVKELKKLFNTNLIIKNQ